MSEKTSVPLATMEPSKISEKRSVAEWLTLFVSSVLLVSVIGFLVYRIWTSSDEQVGVQLKMHKDKAQHHGNQYLVPIEAYNPGNRTLSYLKVEVTYPPREAGGKSQSTEIEMEYLVEKERRTIYLVLDEDPNTLNVALRPSYYRLE